MIVSGAYNSVGQAQTSRETPTNKKPRNRVCWRSSGGDREGSGRGDLRFVSALITSHFNASGGSGSPVTSVGRGSDGGHWNVPIQLWRARSPSVVNVSGRISHGGGWFRGYFVPTSEPRDPCVVVSMITKVFATLRIILLEPNITHTQTRTTVHVCSLFVFILKHTFFPKWSDST